MPFLQLINDLQSPDRGESSNSLGATLLTGRIERRPAPRKRGGKLRGRPGRKSPFDTLPRHLFRSAGRRSSH